MNTLVFVFGTLKEGFPNFGTNTGTRVPGDYKTVELYPLYLIGERHSPWLVNSPGKGEQVVGQVFSVESGALSRMDVLERVSEADGYDRILIKVRPQFGNPEHEINVHAYLKHHRHLDGAEIMGGPFAQYTLEHAALYRKRAR